MTFRIFTLLILLFAVPAFAQDDDAVNPVELDLSGTPAEICEAATPAIEPESRTFEAPEEVLEGGIDYRAVICTSEGAVYLDLFEQYAPATVNNFVFLAEQNYFNNTIFHRVLQDFMAQGGDPTGTGTGGPGYRFQDEFTGFITFDRPGLLAMANSGPATNGSQFFITTAETPWLNGGHTIFGEVLEGQAETVQNLVLRDPQSLSNPDVSSDLEAVVIIRDPEQVDTTFEETVEVASPETFVEGFDLVLGDESLPEDLVFDGAETLTTAEVVERAPADLQEGYADFLESNNHEYRVSAVVDGPECNETYFFFDMAYVVDAFSSAEDATAAFESDFLPEYYSAVDYAAVNAEDDQPFSYRAYVNEQELCDATVETVTLDILRGRYLANVTVILNPVGDGGPSAAARAEVALRLFETALGEAYASEFR